MLSQALRLIRIYHGLKQKDLADRLSVSPSYISELERGKRVPNMEMIEKYGRIFDMSPSSILFFSENIENPNKRNERVHKFIAGKALSFLDNLAKIIHLEEKNK